MDFSQLISQAGVAVAFAIGSSYLLWRYVVSENQKKDARIDKQDISIQELHSKIEGVLMTTIKESTAAMTKFNELVDNHANVLPKLYSHLTQISKKLKIDETYENT